MWTQHTYHVTNADSNGNVPMMEQDNWTAMPPLNNFRQNVQGEGVFNAADLTASLAVSLDKCSAELVLKATIYNEGALGVPAGIDVTFYEGTDNTGLKLGTKPTIEPLLTGGSTSVTWTIDAPMGKKNYFVEVDGGVDNGIIPECDDANNGALVTHAPSAPSRADECTSLREHYRGRPTGRPLDRYAKWRNRARPGAAGRAIGAAQRQSCDHNRRQRNDDGAR